MLTLQSSAEASKYLLNQVKGCDVARGASRIWFSGEQEHHACRDAICT